jgi:hypothetical protein
LVTPSTFCLPPIAFRVGSAPLGSELRLHLRPSFPSMAEVSQPDFWQKRCCIERSNLIRPLGSLIELIHRSGFPTGLKQFSRQSFGWPEQESNPGTPGGWTP